jgi:putative MATE family efflux protein
MNKKNIFTIALPIIFQSVVHQLQILIDRAFLGQIETSYLSAIGNVMIPYIALISFGWAGTSGISILVSQRLGGGLPEKAREYTESGIFYFTNFFTALAAVWILFPAGIFSLLGAKGEVLAFAVSYVRILAISLVFLGIDASSAAALQGSGYTAPIMVVGVIKNLLNILLDYLLIFGHLGLPRLEVEGAAIATTISNIVGTILLFLWLKGSTKIAFSITIRNILSPVWSSFKEILKVGVPAGTEAMLWHAGQVVIAVLLNGLDQQAIGIFTLIFGIQILVAASYFGFAQAAQTLVGFKWGEKKFLEGIAMGISCFRITLLVCSGFFFILISLPEPILKIFSSDQTVIDRGVILLYIVAVNIFLQGANVVIGAGIRGTGNTLWMLYSQIFGTVYVLTMAWFSIYHLNWGLPGLYLTIASDELIRGFINFLKLKFYSLPKLQEQTA